MRSWPAAKCCTAGGPEAIMSPHDEAWTFQANQTERDKDGEMATGNRGRAERLNEHGWGLVCGVLV